MDPDNEHEKLCDNLFFAGHQSGAAGQDSNLAEHVDETVSATRDGCAIAVRILCFDVQFQ
jgi:hypothetical protein